MPVLTQTLQPASVLQSFEETCCFIAVVTIMEKVHCKAGETLIQQGKADTRLFVLEAGTLEILKGDTQIALLDQPHTIVGEISVILNRKRTCRVVAQTDCELMLVGNDINEIINNSPRLTKLILEELAERLENTTATLAETERALITRSSK